MAEEAHFDDSLSRADASRLFQIVDAFEEAWQSGRRPNVDDCLPADALLRQIVLVKLIHVDLEYRLRSGEDISVESYLTRYPEIGANPAAAAELAAWEQKMRRRTASLGVTFLEATGASNDTPKTEKDGPVTRIRCPHCHNPIQVGDKQSDEVLCPGCGSSFRLRDAKYTDTTSGMKSMGKFQLLERLGLGGFGAVWKARDTELDRMVALKIPHAGLLTQEEELERFQREARAAAQLRHPNIVSVHEVAILNGLPVIVAEFVAGVPLKDLLEVRRLTFRQTAALIAQVADGLDYAHSLGVVHRDIKPANLMLLRGLTVQHPAAERATRTTGELADIGKPMILDFGLALRDAIETTMTVDGHILGTPAYMSPEQAAGQSHQADRRSDVYSLGVVLYELLTGELPFRGARLMMLDQVLHEEPRQPRRINDKIPRDLETICLKCLEKQPARRFESGQELALDLRRYLAGEPVRARPVSGWERAVKWLKRHPAIAGLYGMILAAVVGLTIATALLFAAYERERSATKTARDAQVQAENDRKQAEGDRRIAVDEKRRADKASLKAEREEFKTGEFLYAADLHLLSQHWQRGDVSSMGPLLQRHQPKAGAPERRGFEWFYLNRLAGTSEPWTLRAHASGVSCIAYSADGLTMGTGDESGNVFLWDTATRRPRHKIQGHTAAVRWLAFLTNGKSLATAGDDRAVRIWDLDNGREQASKIVNDKEEVVSMVMSSDGRLLAAAFRDETAKVWDMAESKPRARMNLKHSGYDNSIQTLAFAPDGKTLALAYSQSRVRLWNAATDQFVEEWSLDTKVVALAFSSRSQMLAMGQQNGTVAWRSETKENKVDRPGHYFAARCVAFSPDEKLLASGGDDDTVRVWARHGNMPITIFKGHTDRVQALAFSPDGKTLASASSDGTVKIWPLDFRQDRQLLPAPILSRGPVVFSGDGRTLAVVCQDETVRLVDHATTKTWAILPHGQGNTIRSHALAAAGDALAIAGERSVKAWSTSTGKELATLPLLGSGICLAMAPDGKTMAVCVEKGETRLWEVATGVHKALPQSEVGQPHTAAFSPDGKTLALGSGEAPFLRLWDVALGKARVPPFKYDGPAVDNLVFSHDGRLVAFSARAPQGNSFDVMLWDTAQGTKPAALSSPPFNPQSLIFSSDDKTLAIGWGNVLETWDVPTRKLRISFRGIHNYPITGLAFHPDGHTLATSAAGDGTARIWNWRTWQFRQPVGLPLDPVQALLFAPDSKTLFVGSRKSEATVSEDIYIGGVKWGRADHPVSRGDGNIVLLDAATGQALGPFHEKPCLGVRCLALTPDGQTLLAGSAGGTIWPRNLVDKQDRATLFASSQEQIFWQGIEEVKKHSPLPLSPEYSEAVRALAVSPNGMWFASASAPDRVLLWDLKTGRVRHTLGRHAEVASVAFSPDSTKLAANDGGQVLLWDVAAGALLERLEYHKAERLESHKASISCLAFSPSGEILAAGARDRQVHLWNLQSLVKQELIGHTEIVTSIAFTPDGKTLASAGWDGSVRLWNVATAQPLAILEGHSGRVHAVAFSPNGQFLASGGDASNGTGEVLLWRAK